MSGAKETPRQKMIGMMYLVYTALLAMNVSASILDAFALVSDGQQKTNSSIEIKINDQYNAFRDQYNKEPEKTQLYWDQAQAIRNKTDEMVNYIEKDVKLQMLLNAEKIKSEEALMHPKDPKKDIILNKEKANPNNRRVFYDIDLSKVGAKDNTETPINMMINNGKAKELKQKINEYREFIVSTMESVGMKDYGSHVGLLTDYDQKGEKIIYKDANGVAIDWEEKHFDHIVVAAEMAILNKLVGEIQTTEYDAVSQLMSRIGATDFKFNRLQAKVIADRDYILEGEEYQAEVFLVASDTTRNFKAYYSLGRGNQIEATSDKGVVKLKFKGHSLGEQKYTGVIKMTNPETGEEEDYEFGQSFTVAQPTATIAATKMNVMYSGLDNPISISAPGYTPDEINVRVTGGTLKTVNKAKGDYEVTPNSVKEEVHVYATVMRDGKSKELCNKNYRVKPTPDPKLKVGGVYSGGKIGRGELFAAGKLEAEMPDFDFEGYSYEIVSYKPVISGGGTKTLNKIEGARFSSELNNIISKASKGTVIYFEDIVVKAPDKSLRNGGIIKITID